MGYPSGKNECWYVVDAEENATLGLGLVKTVSPTKLKAAAVLGEIEQLIDWKPVKKGDFFFVPAGTIHAIGPGLSIVEVQQNADITFRIYDYGRDRELQLDDALKVAKFSDYDMANHSKVSENESAQLVDGPSFRLFQIIGDDRTAISEIESSEWQILPISGKVKVRDKQIKAGECGICPHSSDIDLSQNERALLACAMK